MSQVQLQYARQECMIQSELKHDNVVELFDYTENDQEIVLLMEYCNDAGYFEDKIETRLTPIMNQVKLQSFSQDILSGLSYIHSLGVIHSDMKLQNALVQRPDQEEAEAGELPIVKLCDFGLSHIMNPSLNNQALMVEKCGTGGYIAPEV